MSSAGWRDRRGGKILIRVWTVVEGDQQHQAARRAREGTAEMYVA